MNRKRKQQELIKRAYGTEPAWHNVEFESDEDRSDRLWKAKSWYRERTTTRDKKKWVVEYTKATYNEETKKAVSSVSSKFFSETIAVLCRCKIQGLELTSTEAATIEESITKLKDMGVENLKNQKPKKSIQERIEEQVSEYCGMMCEVTDQILDQIVTRKSVTFNMKNWLLSHKVKALQAKRIAEYIKPTMEEVLETIEGTDPQLVEGYSYMTKPMLKKWARILSAIIVACEDHALNHKSQRKPRKRKDKTPAQLTAKIKYKEKSDEFGLVSIDPAKIIGATTVVIFNTKYRHLTVYRSKDVTGFSIKGTTIQNFDEKTSETKTVRKTNGLDKIAGIRTFNKYWATLKTKSKVPSGRINSNVIIMKAYE